MAVPLASASFSQVTPYSPPGADVDLGPTLPGSFCGLEETTFSDPGWIMMTSDRLVRSSDCVLECADAPTAWFDLAPGPPCYVENRYWKFADEDEVASIFPMSSLGVGTFDGLYIKSGIDAQFFTGSDTQDPFGPEQTGPLYVSIDFWQIACEPFDPGTFFVTGGPGALGEYSLTLNGGCKGEVLWQDGNPIEGAVVTAYALQQSGSDVVAVPVGPAVMTDADGNYEVPDGMSKDMFPDLPGELGATRGVMASITYTEDTGIQTQRTITNYPFWDPLHTLGRQQTGTEQIFFPFPVIFQPGVAGQYNSGSAARLSAFLTADPGRPSSGISGELFRTKQGLGYPQGIPAFPFWGMPSRDVFGPYPNDGVSWGYDNSAFQSASSVADSAVRMELHLLNRVLPEFARFSSDPVAINMTGHSLGGAISRRWVNRGWSQPRLNKYVTFDAVHGGTKLIINNSLPNLLNEFQMNGLQPLFGEKIPGWNDANSISTSSSTMLFAAVDENIVINPSVSAFGIGRIFEQTLLFGFQPSGECLRSVGGWELEVPGRGHSVQNEDEVMVSTGRFLAGQPATIGTIGSPGTASTSASFSGTAAALCGSDLAGSAALPAQETIELNAMAGLDDRAPLSPGAPGEIRVSALLIGEGSAIAVFDGAGVEVAASEETVAPIEAGVSRVDLSVQLPAGDFELRLSAAGSDATAIVDVRYVDGVGLSVTTDASVVAEGDAVLIEASLLDPAGAVLTPTSSAASAGVRLPNGGEVLVDLTDDGLGADAAAGDGVFTGSFSMTADAGFYALSSEISGDLAGVTLRRTSGNVFLVASTDVGFVGTVTESLVDDDTNGLAEALRFDLQVQAQEPGTYSVRADLLDVAGETIAQLSAAVEVRSAPSVETVSLEVSAQELRQNGNFGIYTLARIVAIDDSQAVVADRLVDWMTGAYTASQFEGLPTPLLERCLPVDDSTLGGGQILLVGKNLDDVTDVFVGSSPATSILKVSDESILFVAPAGPEGPTTIRVVTPQDDIVQQGLFRYVAESNSEPLFLGISPCGQTVDANVGSSVFFQVEAQDFDFGDIVSLDVVGLPSGASTTPALPLSGNPVMTSFQWLPSNGDAGTHVVTFVATDVAGEEATCAVTIDVAGGGSDLILDFETEDDLVTPLINGQVIHRGFFGTRMLIGGLASSGAGIAVFDTDPQGANSMGSDQDLLVGLGNCLILQGNPATQTTPGFYDEPHDDANGGDIFFRFVSPSTLRSIDLIDVDAGVDGGSTGGVTLTLVDTNGGTRTYVVPAGWTEDVEVHGGAGFRTLDLTTLMDQPGFAATATASQSASFDPTSVSQLALIWSGSGALDNLVLAGTK